MTVGRKFSLLHTQTHCRSILSLPLWHSLTSFFTVHLCVTFFPFHLLPSQSLLSSVSYQSHSLLGKEVLCSDLLHGAPNDKPGWSKQPLYYSCWSTHTERERHTHTHRMAAMFPPVSSSLNFDEAAHWLEDPTVKHAWIILRLLLTSFPFPLSFPSHLPTRLYLLLLLTLSCFHLNALTLLPLSSLTSHMATCPVITVL